MAFSYMPKKIQRFAKIHVDTMYVGIQPKDRKDHLWIPQSADFAQRAWVPGFKANELLPLYQGDTDKVKWEYSKIGDHLLGVVFFALSPEIAGLIDRETVNIINAHDSAIYFEITGTYRNFRMSGSIFNLSKVFDKKLKYQNRPGVRGTFSEQVIPKGNLYTAQLISDKPMRVSTAEAMSDDLNIAIYQVQNRSKRLYIKELLVSRENGAGMRQVELKLPREKVYY